MADGRWELADSMQGRSLERRLSDGTVLNVSCYEYPPYVEYQWEIKLFDDATQSYRCIFSIDSNETYAKAMDAYNGMCRHIEANFSHLLENDVIETDPAAAASEFEQAVEDNGFGKASSTESRVLAVVYAWEYGESYVHEEIYGTRRGSGEIVWDEPEFNPDGYDDEFYSVEIFDAK